MTNFALFIGTGSSLGVPVMGCHCEVCTSQETKNQRLRSSLLLSYESKQVLIDAGPDMRLQALRHHIDRLDGVILTHAHHDHTAGLDDLRVYYHKNRLSLPCLVSRETAKDLQQRFYFLLKPQPHEIQNKERLQLTVLDTLEGEINFIGLPIQYFSYTQIGMQVLGIRIGSFAYVTDIKEYNYRILEALSGVKTLIVSALRFTPSHMHFTVDEALDFIQKVNPEKAYLTHLAHELDYEKTNAYLPPSVRLAYDGLKIPLYP